MNGKVIDAQTNAPIYNVQVFYSDAAGNIVDPPTGTTTNFDGEYMLAGDVSQHVAFRHVNYQPVVKKLTGPVETLNATMQAGHEIPGVEIVYDTRPWYIKYSKQLAVGTGLAMLAILAVPSKNQKK